jgi:hypothetical protein
MSDATTIELQRLNSLARQFPEVAPAARARMLEVAAGAERANQYIGRRNDHPPAQGSYVEPFPLPTRYLVLPTVPLVAPGVPSAPISLTFEGGGGWLVGWRCVAVDPGPPAAAGALEQAQAGVMLRFADNDDLITDGQGQAWASLATVFQADRSWAPLLRHVEPTEICRVSFNNFYGAGGPSLELHCTFAFIRDSIRDRG